MGMWECESQKGSSAEKPTNRAPRDITSRNKRKGERGERREDEKAGRRRANQTEPQVYFLVESESFAQGPCVAVEPGKSRVAQRGVKMVSAYSVVSTGYYVSLIPSHPSQ